MFIWWIDTETGTKVLLKTNQIKISVRAQVYKGCKLCLFQREETVEENQKQKVEPAFV